MGAFRRVQTHPDYSHLTQVYITLFAIFLKTFFLSLTEFTNNDPVLLFKLHLGTEIVFCRLLQLTDGKDLNLKKLDQLFQVLMIGSQLP